MVTSYYERLRSFFGARMQMYWAGLSQTASHGKKAKMGPLVDLTNEVQHRGTHKIIMERHKRRAQSTIRIHIHTRAKYRFCWSINCTEYKSHTPTLNTKSKLLEYKSQHAAGIVILRWSYSPVIVTHSEHKSHLPIRVGKNSATTANYTPVCIYNNLWLLTFGMLLLCDGG